MWPYAWHICCPIFLAQSLLANYPRYPDIFLMLREKVELSDELLGSRRGVDFRATGRVGREIMSAWGANSFPQQIAAREGNRRRGKVKGAERAGKSCPLTDVWCGAADASHAKENGERARRPWGAAVKCQLGNDEWESEITICIHSSCISTRKEQSDA